jgi:hypothetical protein
MSKQRGFEPENENARSWKRKRTFGYVRPAKGECCHLLAKSDVMRQAV